MAELAFGFKTEFGFITTGLVFYDIGKEREVGVNQNKTVFRKGCGINFLREATLKFK